MSVSHIPPSLPGALALPVPVGSQALKVFQASQGYRVPKGPQDFKVYQGFRGHRVLKATLVLLVLMALTVLMVLMVLLAKSVREGCKETLGLLAQKGKQAHRGKCGYST
ncbi:hypothetical protein PG990_000593 [Apiospora arundinis]